MAGHRSTARFRVLRHLCLLAAVALVVTACGDDDVAEPDDTETTEDGSDDVVDDGDSDEEAAEPVSDTLRVMIGSEPRLMTPFIDTSRYAQQVSRAFVEPLVGKGEDNLPDGSGIVTEWEQVDESTWRFVLRDGVVFHNGERLDADAAAQSVIANRDTGILGAYFAILSEVRAVDDLTLEVETAVPTGGDLVPALMTEVYALPPEYFGEVGAEGFGLQPVGTGPYVFDEWQSGQFIRATRFDEYWRGAPSIEFIEWRFAPDPSARLSALLAGDADFTVVLAPQAMPQLDASDDLVGVPFRGSNRWLAGFDRASEPLDDERIRLAIAHAIDRDSLVNAVLEGQGGVVATALLHGMFESSGRNTDEIPTYDPDTAAGLVEEVRAERGDLPPIVLSYASGRYIQDTEMGEAVAGQLEAIGLQIERNPTEPGEFLGLLLTNQLTGIHLTPYEVRYPHEDNLMRTILTSDGLVRYCTSDQLDALAAEGRSGETADVRNDAYAEAERIALLDEGCMVVIFDQIENYGHVAVLEGFTPRFDQLIDYHTMSFTTG